MWRYRVATEGADRGQSWYVSGHEADPLTVSAPSTVINYCPELFSTRW